MPLDRSWIEQSLQQHDCEVAHYTSIETLGHLLEQRLPGISSLRASPVQFLNDREELMLGLEILKGVADRKPRSGMLVREMLENLTYTSGSWVTDAFQMSSSAVIDDLGQWRGYAANGMGCSVVMRSDGLRRLGNVAGWIIYDHAKQRAFAYKVLAKLRGCLDYDVIEKVLVGAACFMKHEGFKQEQEFRVIRFADRADSVEFRATGDRILPFVDLLRGQPVLRLERLLIGPGWQLKRLEVADFVRHPVVQGLGRLFEARGIDAPIQHSSIPYDPK